MTIKLEISNFDFFFKKMKVHDLFYSELKTYTFRMTIVKIIAEVEVSSSTTSVAERELSAVLSRRQRAEATIPDGSILRSQGFNYSLPTFPKDALDPEQHHIWNDFVIHNRTCRKRISVIVCFLSLIYCLQCYTSLFH